MDEFSSQKSGNNTNTDISSTDWSTIFPNNEASDDSDTDSQTRVKQFKVKSSQKASQPRQGSGMSDQTLINDKILSQLDTISKCLDAIENTTAFTPVRTLHE